MNFVRPTISIVLPVYNHAQYLAAGIESILLACRRYPLQLIIVDDGSQDNCAEVLADFALPNITVLRQENRGLSAALNRGFAHATGLFWGWTSADNLYDQGSLDKLADFLCASPQSDLVYANVRLIDDRGQPLRDSSYRKSDQSPLDTSVLHLAHEPETLCCFNDNFINACFLYRRHCAKLIGDYSPEYRGYEDYDYWLRFLQLGNLSHLGEDSPLYAYRIHQNSLTAELRDVGLAKLQQPLLARCSKAIQRQRRMLRLSYTPALGPHATALNALLENTLGVRHLLDMKDSLSQCAILSTKDVGEGGSEVRIFGNEARDGKILSSKPRQKMLEQLFCCPRLRVQVGNNATRQALLPAPIQVPTILKRARSTNFGAATPHAESIEVALSFCADTGDHAVPQYLDFLATRRNSTLMLYCETQTQRQVADAVFLGAQQRGVARHLRILDVSTASDDPWAENGSLCSLLYVLGSADYIFAVPKTSWTGHEISSLRLDLALGAVSGKPVCSNCALCPTADEDIEAFQEILAAPHLIFLSGNNPRPAFEQFLAQESFDAWLHRNSLEYLGELLTSLLFLPA